MASDELWASVDLVDAKGVRLGELRLRRVQRAPPGTLALHEPLPGEAYVEERVQLLESAEYRYDVTLDLPRVLASVAPAELFDPDDESQRTGRLRPGLNVGTLAIIVTASDGSYATARVEVRARKLDYRQHYRWMLRDIAHAMTELLLHRFAPSTLMVAPDPAKEAATLYQRFAFLRALLTDGALDVAIEQIQGRPHRRWVREEFDLPPSRGAPAGSALARQVTRPGPRVRWGAASPVLGLDTLPARVTVGAAHEVLDTPENRFVRFALERWRATVNDLLSALRRTPTTAVRQRGEQEASGLLAWVDGVLGRPFFSQIGPLGRVPLDSQVLQKREGYREVLRAYIQFEAAARLVWSTDDDVFAAGRRDVATLYEYWVYFQLAALLGRLADREVDWSSLVAVRDDGLGVALRRGHEHVLSVPVERGGRRFDLTLFFNHRFRADASSAASWTLPMRPDCSLRVCSREPDAIAPEEVWIHFDAKYRIDGLDDLFVDSEARGGELVGTQAKRVDLLKMHAYRDAIRRTAGAYVIYPGTKDQSLRQFHEILPGLGAFALRPGEDARPDGANAVERFLHDVLDHVASQSSQHERWRFWTHRIFDSNPAATKGAPLAFLDEPPADVDVLVGFLRAPWHLAWVKLRGRYNLRADKRPGSVRPGARELSARYALLAGEGIPDSLWRLTGEVIPETGEQLSVSGYVDPHGALYLSVILLPVALSADLSARLAGVSATLRARVVDGSSVGAPFVVRLLEVLAALT